MLAHIYFMKRRGMFRSKLRTRIPTALFEVPSLRKLGGGRPFLTAGRPALRSAGQSGDENRAGLQVTPVVSPLGPLPGLPGVQLHLTPGLPPEVQLQESPLLGCGHCVLPVCVFSGCTVRCRRFHRNGKPEEQQLRVKDL